jgi:hypothetical protein
MIMTDRSDHPAIAVPCRCGHILAIDAREDDDFAGPITLLQSRRLAARFTIREYRDADIGDHLPGALELGAASAGPPGSGDQHSSSSSRCSVTSRLERWCCARGWHRADTYQELMFWWFERRGKFTCLEVLELPTGGYEVRVLAPDGTEQIEHVATYAELKVRYDFVRAQLHDTEWTGPTNGPT